MYDDFNCNIRFGPVIFGKHRQWTYVDLRVSDTFACLTATILFAIQSGEVAVSLNFFKSPPHRTSAPPHRFGPSRVGVRGAIMVPLFILFLFVLEFCHNKIALLGCWAGDQGHRSVGLGKVRGARRARRRRNRWRQAMTPLSCGAMPPTEGSAQPSTTLGGVVIPARPRLKRLCDP